MADENITKTAEELEQENEISRSQQRIKQLSEKVELTSKERDELQNSIEERDNKIADLERNNSFNEGFADVLGAHPAARDHRDAIKEKVMGGYSVEDATYAVLGKAGQLGTPDTETTKLESTTNEAAAGGSADTVINQGGDKPVGEMTQEERRAKLSEELMFT